VNRQTPRLCGVDHYGPFVSPRIRRNFAGTVFVTPMASVSVTWSKFASSGATVVSVALEVHTLPGRLVDDTSHARASNAALLRGKLKENRFVA